ncbi:Universal stress protein [Halomicronema hongdechloris C2206]|uniref:Universal stress protein n=1 Tax=Halomicronema hongdechloris C2206 TaxID=1641165 RepID=A0A1Z3HNW2_9CYAN|nr:universal stress protein [Halomicronema hongdechloris]ASC71960.1 Universal stress protein [Halomicronema hongdechloris C2206]
MAAYHKILVALDSSPLSDKVFTCASTLAKQQGAKLMLIHCFTLPKPHQDFGDRYGANLGEFLSLAQTHIEEGMEATRQWLNGYAQTAKDMTLDVDWDWYVGEAGPQICAAAEDWNADLIVVGRRGHTGLQEILLGSVSNYVLHRCRRAVLVVQGDKV